MDASVLGHHRTAVVAVIVLIVIIVLCVAFWKVLDKGTSLLSRFGPKPITEEEYLAMVAERERAEAAERQAARDPAPSRRPVVDEDEITGPPSLL